MTETMTGKPILSTFALLAGLFWAGPAAAADWIEAAPSGDPMKVATEALGTAKTSCGEVKKAKRLKDGIVDANCSTGARFLVFTMKGSVMTKRCLPSQALGVHGC